MSRSPTDHVRDIFHAREAPVAALAADAGVVAAICRAMAERFRRGGKLVVFGNGGPSTDAQHVAVEFVHPVIVGKRALPAISLTADVATLTGIASRVGVDEVFAHQLRVLAEPADIALGISTDGDCANVRRGLAVARERGMLTVALVGGDGGRVGGCGLVDHLLVARSDDPQVVKEVHVTAYHIVWELVHVFLEEPGGPTAADAGPCVTCSDMAVEARVVRRLPDLMAVVDAGQGEETVSVALVDVEAGDRILVHAGEAILKLPGAS